MQGRCEIEMWCQTRNAKPKKCMPRSVATVSRNNQNCYQIEVEKEENLYFEGQYYKVLYKEPVFVCS